MRNKFGSEENGGIGSVLKALTLLDVIAFDPDWQTGLSLGKLAAHLELPPNSVHGLLASMVSAGYVERTGRGIYRAGAKCHALGVINRTHAPAVSQRLDQALARLARVTGEHCVLAILANGRRRRLAKADSHQAVAATPPEANEDEIFSKSTGRVLAAYASPVELRRIIACHGLPGAAWDGMATEAALAEALARIREDGCAEATDSDRSIWAVSVPVLATDGTCFAALGLYAPLFRATPEARADWTTVLRGTAVELVPILCLPSALERTA